MANITPVDNWSDIPLIEQTDYVLGGEGQIANQQAQALANRTENLKNTVISNKTTQDNKNDSIDAAINDLNTNKVNKSDIVNNATTTASGKVLDGRMGKTLNDTITSNYNTLNTNKVNKSDVVNNYTTTTAGKVLDARVAVSLKTLIDGKQPSGSYVLTSNIVNNATTTVSGKVLDGRMGKTLNDLITSNYNTLNTNKINKSDIVTNYTTNNNSKVLAASVGVSLKALIDTKINTSDAVKIVDIINNLTSTATNKPLSAAQGKALNDKLVVFTKSGSTASQGLVPKPSTTAGTTKFLCEDATWKVPSGSTVEITYVETVLFRCTEMTYSNGFKLKIILYKNGNAWTSGGNAETITFAKPFSTIASCFEILESNGHFYLLFDTTKPNISAGSFSFDNQYSETTLLSKTNIKISYKKMWMILIAGY